MLTAQDNATLVRAFYDTFNRRDFDKALAMVTDDAQWTNIPFSATFSGRKGYREYISTWTTAMPDSKVEIVNVLAADDWAVAECIGRGTHTGPLAGPQGNIPATQKHVDMKFCEVLRLKDGQITEAHLYFDAASLLRQLGLMPETQSPNQPVPARH